MKRPGPGDCLDYYLGYVRRVPEGEVLETLELEGARTLELLEGIDERHANHRYAPEKWSIKEVVGHVVDTERIFAYRCLAVARGETAPLPGFEQDDYVAGASFGARSLASLATELRALRAANVALFSSLDADALGRVGTVSGHPMRASAIPWIIAGHEIHHRSVLAERYL